MLKLTTSNAIYPLQSLLVAFPAQQRKTQQLLAAKVINQHSTAPRAGCMLPEWVSHLCAAVTG
jgi:hypothetical protein